MDNMEQMRMHTDTNERYLTGGLTMLPIGELHPHPNNPRKDLGDLTELASSIGKNGVMQNLTVVPRDAGGYTIVIGHRRCAAAKLAGLFVLPCVIASLTEREQVGIMLCENMQRADITPYEQAESMQLMLDLGDTVDEIAEKTGFTKKTVKDRLKLTKLDREKLKRACDRQVTLAELLKVADLADEAERNQVLAKAGTNNFHNAYQAAKNKEEAAEKSAYIRKHLASWATERKGGVMQNNDLYRGAIPLRNSKQDIAKKLDEAKEKYGAYSPTWREDYGRFVIYSQRSAEEKENAAHDATKRERQERIREFFDKLQEIGDRHRALRLDFVQNIRLGSSAYVDVLLQEFLTRCIERGYESDAGYLRVLAPNKGRKDIDKKIKSYRNRPEDLLFLLVYVQLGDMGTTFFEQEWASGEFVIRHNSDNSLLAIYDFLCQYGYEMSDEEIDMREGRHEVYREYLAFMEGEKIDGN